MRRCPTCNREYSDESLSFCLDDGAKLEATGSSSSQATLVISPETLQTMQANARQTDPNPAPAPSYSPPPNQYVQPAPSWNNPPPPPSYASVAAAPKRGALPWVIGGVAVLVVGTVGIILLVIIIAAVNSDNNNNNNNSKIVVNKNNNSDRSTPTPTPVATGKTLNSKDGVSQITVPEGWDEATDLNKSATIQASNVAQSLYAIVITDKKADLASSNTLERYADDRSTKLTETLTNLTKTGPESITINGNSGLLYEIHGEISGIKAAYLFGVVETSGHFHQIGSWTSESNFADKRSTMLGIIESLREK